ncbi:hypothetical protein GCM10027449_03040 [Sinomonas notoginsengisoli]
MMAASAGILTATSLVACHGEVACPAIAAAPFLTVHISADLAATLNSGSVTATACQDAGCHGGPLALADEQASGSASVPGKVGRIGMGSLRETPIDLTVSAQDLQGQHLGDYRLQFAPRISYPWGSSCPRVVTAEVSWDRSGLHPSMP